MLFTQILYQREKKSWVLFALHAARNAARVVCGLISRIMLKTWKQPKEF